jgi:hypothetical protein
LVRQKDWNSRSRAPISRVPSDFSHLQVLGEGGDGTFLNGHTDTRHGFFRFRDALAALYGHIAGKGLVPGINFPHPALQKGSFPGLPGGMEYPIQLIPDIPVKLGAYQALLRGSI